MKQRGRMFHSPRSSDEETEPLHRSIVTKPTIEQTPFEAFNFENLWRTVTTTEPRSPTPELIESKPQSPTPELIESKPWDPTPEPRTETEASEASFNTVPELSEPTENLFTAIVNRNRLNPNPLRTTQPRSKEATTPMAFTAMNVDIPPHHNRIQAGRVVPFSGKRNTLEKFIDNLCLHFILNKIRDDEEKVVFTLTYIEGGDADSWKAAFLKNVYKDDGTVNFRTWSDLVKELRDNFKPYNLKGDALDEINKLRQGSTSIEDHVARFKVLLTNSGVAADSPAALDYFQKSLRVPLFKRIMDLAKVPTELTKWYKWALKLDANYHRLMLLLNRGKPEREEKEVKPRWTFWRTEKDPNAMDIDMVTRTYNTMTNEERTELMKKGLCFRCKKPGHLSCDCPDKKGKTPPAQTPANTSTPKKMTAKELTAHIQSLTALLDENEKNEFYNEAKKEGF